MRTAQSTLYLALGLVVALILGASAVNAQSNQEQGQQGQGQYEQNEQNQPKAEDFSSSEIESFISARKEIDDLRKDFQPKFQEAEDVDKAQNLREEFQKKAIQILDEQGLDVQTYNSIVKGMDSNKDLRQKVQERMDD
ncbi:MAG: DUF4168 domain-containing protein [Desulfovermiculus sp.]